MGSNRGGNQLREALLGAGFKPAAGATRQPAVTRDTSSPAPRERNPLTKAAPAVISDLPESWSRDPPESPETSAEPRNGRNAAANGSQLGRSNGGNAAGKMQALVHGKPSAHPVPATPSAPPPPPSARMLKKGAFHPHPLLDPKADERPDLPALAYVGFERQLARMPSDATVFVIGLDFGTSTTKAVLRDIYREVALPVRFRGEAPGIDAFLLPSSLCREGEFWSLSGDGARIRDLKLRLLHAQNDDPVDEFNDCCAFLALVIRRCRAWLLTEHGKEYRRHAIEWRLNLGIAARSYEDKMTVARFRRLAWAAANVASQPTVEIDRVTVDRYRLRSKIALDSGVLFEGEEFQPDQIDVVPEISAQLQGFMRSARWDWRNRPVMMLVDVGAGTVDTALFMVGIHEGKPPVLVFFANRVEQNGVINLHRLRIDWLDKAARAGEAEKAVLDYLAAHRVPTDRLRPIPETVGEYVPGYDIDCRSLNADDEFMKHNYRRQVAGCIQDARVGKGLSSNDLDGMPLLLCGGGARMRYFSRIADIIKETKEWSFKVEKLSMPVPAELADFGMNSDEFDRLSVAFGLAQIGEGDKSIGTIVRATDVPAQRPLNEPTPGSRPEAISKDHM